MDALGVMSIGHISVECSKSARRVVESFFPEVIAVSDVSEVDEEMVKSWACKFTQASVVLLGAGPPCQGVSGLNSQRKGATRDRRSSLYFHLLRIRILVIKYFPWAQVHSLMESVASMDGSDRAIMSESEGSLPWQVDAVGVSLARRPRLYWLTWEVVEESEVSIYPPDSNSGWEGFGTIDLKQKLFSPLNICPQGGRKSLRNLFLRLLPLDPGITVALDQPDWINAPLPRSSGGRRIFIGSLLINIGNAFASVTRRATLGTPMCRRGNSLWVSPWVTHPGACPKVRAMSQNFKMSALPSWETPGMSPWWFGCWVNSLVG